MIATGEFVIARYFLQGCVLVMPHIAGDSGDWLIEAIIHCLLVMSLTASDSGGA